MRKLRSLLWNSSRILGWVIAIIGGPGKLGARVVRATILRNVGRRL